jgi:hypothetical protein
MPASIAETAWLRVPSWIPFRTLYTRGIRAGRCSVANDNITPIKTRPPPQEEDVFGDLMRRMLVGVNQLKLAAKDFGDLASLPEEHVAAAMVMQEATEELDMLYDALDAWHVTHEHSPKEARS